ncbi:MAG: hypothetical protein AB7Q42_20980 [Acidimicrobiia bacterium]
MSIVRSWFRVVTAITVAVLVVAGCGGDDDSASPRPLTDDEANLLANALFDNYAAGGATFQLAIQVAPGATINLQGEIDWSTHRGHAIVVGKGTEEGIQEVFWDDASVVERRDGLVSVLAQTGHPGVGFVGRPVDVERRDLDQALALVTGLASEQRDNPLLIKQTEGSGFVRTDELHGVAANVLRYGPLTTYWLAADDARMLRFEGNNTPGTRPVVIELLGLGAQQIEPPPSDQIVDVAEIAELYDGVVSAPASG